MAQKTKRHGSWAPAHEFTHNDDGTTTFVVESKKHGNQYPFFSTSEWERVKSMSPWSISLMRDSGCYFACTIIHPDGGTYRNQPRRTRLSLHRFITQCPKGLEVDHSNHNKLDNTNENLRICTRAENGKNQQKKKINTTGYIGIAYSPPVEGMISERSKPWRSAIVTNGKSTQLGAYATKEEAALVRDNAAKNQHGEFAYLNFPNGPSQEVLKIIKEGQESVPPQSSKYWGVYVHPKTGSITVNINYNNNQSVEEDHFHQTVQTEEEGALIRDRIIKLKGINAPLNFPDGPSKEVLKIIKEGKEKARTIYNTLINDRYIYCTSHRHGKGKPYYVMMIYNGKQKRIGSFNNLEEARIARDKALSERAEKTKFCWKTSQQRKHKL